MEASESQRVVYIITYSRADTEKFRRETFGEAIIEAWNSFNIEISHWVVSMEGHATTDATSDAPIVFIRAGAIDQTNTNMMDIRWSFFRFWKPISQSEQREIAPCGHCFARFILENSSNVYIAD